MNFLQCVCLGLAPPPGTERDNSCIDFSLWWLIFFNQQNYLYLTKFAYCSNLNTGTFLKPGSNCFGTTKQPKE